MSPKTRPRLAAIVPDLLRWFDRARRDLPWRTPPGTPRDPYRVWLSEIMLQQTTVPHAAPYFERFTARWPTVQKLAAAKDDEVMQAWAGLGYYARARNLLKCAREVSARGGFPATEAELRTLPGIGPYTAGAIAALAFGEPAPAIDGNAERVFARLLATSEPWPVAKKLIGALARELVPANRPGDFAEALMDLGATICLPRSPNCAACPLVRHCAANSESAPERYPVKPVKEARPVRHGTAYVLRRAGHVWLVRRST
jgi:A/G-specific adenine glycosylase